MAAVAGAHSNVAVQELRNVAQPWPAAPDGLFLLRPGLSSASKPPGQGALPYLLMTDRPDVGRSTSWETLPVELPIDVVPRTTVEPSGSN